LNGHIGGISIKLRFSFHLVLVLDHIEILTRDSWFMVIKFYSCHPYYLEIFKLEKMFWAITLFLASLLLFFK